MTKNSDDNNAGKNIAESKTPSIPRQPLIPYDYSLNINDLPNQFDERKQKPLAKTKQPNAASAYIGSTNVNARKGQFKLLQQWRIILRNQKEDAVVRLPEEPNKFEGIEDWLDFVKNLSPKQRNAYLNALKIYYVIDNFICHSIQSKSMITKHIRTPDMVDLLNIGRYQNKGNISSTSFLLDCMRVFSDFIKKFPSTEINALLSEKKYDKLDPNTWDLLINYVKQFKKDNPVNNGITLPCTKFGMYAGGKAGNFFALPLAGVGASHVANSAKGYQLADIGTHGLQVLAKKFMGEEAPIFGLIFFGPAFVLQGITWLCSVAFGVILYFCLGFIASGSGGALGLVADIAIYSLKFAYNFISGLMSNQEFPKISGYLADGGLIVNGCYMGNLDALEQGNAPVATSKEQKLLEKKPLSNEQEEFLDNIQKQIEEVLQSVSCSDCVVVIPSDTSNIIYHCHAGKVVNKTMTTKSDEPKSEQELMQQLMVKMAQNEKQISTNPGNIPQTLFNSGTSTARNEETMKEVSPQIGVNAARVC